MLREKLEYNYYRIGCFIVNDHRDILFIFKTNDHKLVQSTDCRRCSMLLSKCSFIDNYCTFAINRVSDPAYFYSLFPELSIKVNDILL
jgi:hypothetical protein